MSADDLWNCLSEVLPHRLYFSSYPSESWMDRLQSEGFTHLVDLTDGVECAPYDTRLIRIHFPIADHGIPADPMMYCHLLTRLMKVLHPPDTKLLIHCRGGHGRSGMVCASLWILSQLPQLTTVNQAISVINQAHIARVHLRPKWRTRRMPFNHTQASFLHRMHKIIYLHANDTNGFYGWVLPQQVFSLGKDSHRDEMVALLRDWLIPQYLTRLSTTHMKSFLVMNVPPEIDQFVRTFLFELRNDLFDPTRLTPPQNAAEEKTENANPNPNVPWT
jgi:hypothetical protein